MVDYRSASYPSKHIKGGPCYADYDNSRPEFRGEQGTYGESPAPYGIGRRLRFPR